MGTPNMAHVNAGVNISSNALAKFLSIEFKFFKNILVTNPMAALLHISVMTFVCITDRRLSVCSTASKFPENNINNILHTIEFEYIKMFWIQNSTLPQLVLPFSKYSV